MKSNENVADRATIQNKVEPSEADELKILKDKLKIQIELAKLKGLNEYEINDILEKIVKWKISLDKTHTFKHLVREHPSAQKLFSELKKRMYKILDELEEKGVWLTGYGNANQCPYDASSCYVFNGSDVEDTYDAYFELSIYFEESKRYCEWSSYGLKHIFERLRGDYINNGSFIMACMLRGYKTRIGRNDVNARIKIKVRKEYVDWKSRSLSQGCY